MLVLVLLYRIVLEPSPQVVFDNGEAMAIATPRSFTCATPTTRSTTSSLRYR